MLNTTLKIQFLGTGTSQGIPIIGSDHPVNFSTNPKDKRLRSSVLISKNGRNVAIDCGPDFRQQMLRANVRELDGIVFTHEHNDHVLGIDDTRPFSHFSKKPMEIYAQERVIGEIKNRFPYVFAEIKYPGAPSLNVNLIKKESFEVSGILFQPLEIMHGDLPILGFLIDEKFAYITDASFIPEETMKKIRNAEVLVLNALRKSEKHYSHFTLEEGLGIAQKTNAGKVYFTHISVTMGFHEEVQNELPMNAFLAYDGLEIQI